ncbi:MAG TPA: TOBE domain-containing protein [Fibrobacteria bacterium]|jgi:molybdate transport system regulatory protein|nr:TOBE domain-containing protein [Fibrobacteria bacterium]
MNRPAKPTSGILGEFHAALLENLRETGSITKAAKACGVSYRTAWSHVDRLNELSGQPVVERTAGGKSGGGTRLTSYGAGLLEAYRVLQQRHERYIKDLRKGIQDFEDFQRLARGMSLKTSARNQLFGTVESVKLAGLEAEVVLSLKGGDRLKARITRRSAEDIGIRKGREAYALIKANWVVPVASRRAGKSANLLKGVFEDIHRARGRVETSIRLGGGEALWTSFAEKPAAKIQAKKGAAVRVEIDPANVILGVTDVPRF